MRDFNFFGPYISAPKKKNGRGILLLLLLIIVVGVAAFYQYTLWQQEKALQSEIDDLNAYIDSPEVKESLDRVQEKQMKGDALQEAYNHLQALELGILETDILSDEMLAEIDFNIPKGVFLSSMNLDGDSLSLVGYSEAYESIAQFAHNLRDVTHLRSVFVPQIEKSETYYTFSIQSTLAKEGQDENQ